MRILKIPVASAMARKLAFVFAGAGLFNAIGGAAVQAGLGLSGVVELRRSAWRRSHGSSRNADLGISARGNGDDRRDCYRHVASGIHPFAAGRGAGRAYRHRIGACGRALRHSARHHLIYSALAGSGDLMGRKQPRRHLNQSNPTSVQGQSRRFDTRPVTFA